MNSTDHNINNPFQKSCINLLKTVESWKMPTFVGYISQEEYDLIKIHDPNSIYAVNTDNGVVLYLGDIKIEAPEIKNKYYIGMNDNKEYVVYMDQNSGTGDYFTGLQNLVPICTYADPQVAIDQLSKFNRVGSHNYRDISIYSLLKSYIDKEISTHELIISILVEFNFREDPRLQNLIEFAMSHNVHKCMKEFPAFYSGQIRVMKDNKPESLFVLYSNLYDLVVKYNFFKDKKYQELSDDLNLSTEINDIVKTVYFKNSIHTINYSNII